MATSPTFSNIPILILLIFFSISMTISASEQGNISSFMSSSAKNTPTLDVKIYCESWRTNVELHNIINFDGIPGECISHISNYMNSSQYQADVQLATEEALRTMNVKPVSDYNLDAFIFDIDDTLLSTIPYYQKYYFGNDCCREDNTDRVTLETWMALKNAPAVEHMVEFYNKIKEKGFKIFIISSREEHLRSATIDNLMMVGYNGWKRLILRCENVDKQDIQAYKAKQRGKLTKEGYQLWGHIGDQWSSLNSPPYAKRSFKLPNPMYYKA